MTPRGALLTLPNLVSMSRVVLAAAFVPLADPGARLALLALAGATDLLDGWLARRLDAVTPLGAIVDPIADRIFVLVVVAALTAGGALTAAESLALLVRDVATTVGFFVARTVRWLREVRLEARWPGKVVTVLQLATLVAVLARPDAVRPLLVAVVVSSVVAIVDYTRVLWQARLA